MTKPLGQEHKHRVQTIPWLSATVKALIGHQLFLLSFGIGVVTNKTLHSHSSTHSSATVMVEVHYTERTGNTQWKTTWKNVTHLMFEISKVNFTVCLTTCLLGKDKRWAMINQLWAFLVSYCRKVEHIGNRFVGRDFNQYIRSTGYNYEEDAHTSILQLILLTVGVMWMYWSSVHALIFVL